MHCGPERSNPKVGKRQFRAEGTKNNHPIPGVPRNERKIGIYWSQRCLSTLFRLLKIP